MIERVLSRVPAYSTFLTVDELTESSRRLAAAHPGVVRIVRIGSSTDGEPIEMLRIGDGPEQLLFFACPHPNEPIGAMTLEALAGQLATDEELRGGRYTWNLVKCIDPDSTRLNEGWFKGPFTITHYASEFYRPASFDQAEWSFPVVYKRYSFFRPIPETVALMTAITGLRPRFVYSLHNAGMGGGYYYLSPHKPEIDDALRALMTDRGVPLSLGEPEMPWGVELSPAVYRSTALVDHYDFLERFGEADPASKLQGGEGSYGYAHGICGAAHLVCELPYFYDPRIGDTSPTEISRRDAILEGIEGASAVLGVVAETFERCEGALTAKTRFRTAARELTRLVLEHLPTKRAWAERTPELAAPATVAQRFDNLTVGRFYNLLIVGMACRALAAELAVRRSAELQAAKERLDEHFTQLAGRLEQEIDYRVIPIKTLVEIQLGAALHFIERL